MFSGPPGTSKSLNKGYEVSYCGTVELQITVVNLNNGVNGSKLFKCIIEIM